MGGGSVERKKDRGREVETLLAWLRMAASTLWPASPLPFLSGLSSDLCVLVLYKSMHDLLFA